MNVINSEFISEDFEQKFRNCWTSEHLSSGTETQNGSKIINKPFKCAYMKDFLQDEDLLTNVVDELGALDLQHKNNDLYKFKCTEDLQGVKKPLIEKICKYFQGPIKTWVQKVTGLNLNQKVAISSSRYDYTDVLLCHDDELEGRRIAFILYLVPSWKKKYGGSLDLFSVNHVNQPYSISERIYPQFNYFAFFEVSPVSFHQVSEVLVKDKTRITLNGWFHGEPIQYPQRPISKSRGFLLPGEVEEHVLYSWVNPLYLSPETQAEIRKGFHDKSEIQLPDFLKKKKFDQISADLQKESHWKWIGPPNEKHFEVISGNKTPVLIKEYLQLMHSDAMFLILSQLTGLELHHLAPQSDQESSEDSEVDEKSVSDSGSASETESQDYEERVKSESRNEKGETSSRNVCGYLGDSGSSTCNENKKKRKKSKLNSDEKKKQKVDCDIVNIDNEFTNEIKGAVGGLFNGWEELRDGDNDININGRSQDHNTKAENRSEVRRWRWGSYSLMRDDDLRRNRDFVLDASLFSFGSGAIKQWGLDCGGGIVYVAKGEEEELLTVTPAANSLALVYRDKETFRFTKHINSNSSERNNCGFYEIFCEYRENQ